MPSLVCPHCQHIIELMVQQPDPTEAPWSTRAGTQPGAVLNGAYQPNPRKQYKTPEYLRRAGLAWYYEHREEILLKARLKRAERKQQAK